MTSPAKKDDIHPSIQKLIDVREDVQKRFNDLKKNAKEELEIDPDKLDESVLTIPRLYGTYLDLYSEESTNLKTLYHLRDKIKLERWKYYMGKASDKYYKEYGIIHDKILKTDVDKYLVADDKLSEVEMLVHTQKQMVDYIEKIMKEIGNRNFHIKAALEWRKFQSGGF